MAIWLRDNRRLICAAGGKLYLADSATGKTRELHALANLNLDDPLFSPDEKGLYYCAASLEEDVF